MTGRAQEEVFAEIGPVTITEWQAWVIQRGLTIVLVIAFLHMAWKFVELKDAEQELTEELKRQGCIAVQQDNRFNLTMKRPGGGEINRSHLGVNVTYPPDQDIPPYRNVTWNASGPYGNLSPE